MIIAIDGPAASGKGTLARRLAAHYGLPHLDTGLTFRAVAASLLDSGADLADADAATAAAGRIDLSSLDPARLSAHDIGEAASRIAVVPAVRTELLAAQRRFGRTGKGAVLDGRDIGTVVFPDADVKLYVLATPQARARRRAAEMAAKGQSADVDAIAADLALRDARDANRPIAPLKPADDAVLLDTTDLDIEAAFRAAVRIIDSKLAERS
ncbi:(d)CMP kinase [Segnochrobactraceae bacterium EtOH-i3]